MNFSELADRAFAEASIEKEIREYSTENGLSTVEFCNKFSLYIALDRTYGTDCTSGVVRMYVAP